MKAAIGADDQADDIAGYLVFHFHLCLVSDNLILGRSSLLPIHFYLINFTKIRSSASLILRATIRRAWNWRS
jgi:hypothetical protein